jgi:hypothetical protein
MQAPSAIIITHNNNTMQRIAGARERPPCVASLQLAFQILECPSSVVSWSDNFFGF